MQNIHGQFERETFINIIHKWKFLLIFVCVRLLGLSRSFAQCSYTRLENKVSARVVPNEKRKTCTRNQTASTIYRSEELCQNETTGQNEREANERNKKKKIEIKIKERNPFVCRITMQKIHLVCVVTIDNQQLNAATLDLFSISLFRCPNISGPVSAKSPRHTGPKTKAKEEKKKSKNDDMMYFRSK